VAKKAELGNKRDSADINIGRSASATSLVSLDTHENPMITNSSSSGGFALTEENLAAHTARMNSMEFLDNPLSQALAGSEVPMIGGVGESRARLDKPPAERTSEVVMLDNPLAAAKLRQVQAQAIAKDAAGTKQKLHPSDVTWLQNPLSHSKGKQENVNSKAEMSAMASSRMFPSAENNEFAGSNPLASRRDMLAKAGPEFGQQKKRF